ncbi:MULTISPECIES: hypothetical protein [unclassified Treponema]|uniref:hypothetical protein n=1 Tax=unclassified Treponema TaxID=2638727 RepID=UPI0020A5A45F|nr:MULTISPECIES: hypothetical protein [unclassified Treponema]UTC67144.1 hypothetical protein E4O06_00270 [Treponema sp. OMZ 789]UTC69874.1 hypothetical protein E4O01_00270 [Treponema sp. OMZ 790]UTC72589.1 hypothetical protein E4O02_00270 [Treponema sp. OMZ 791]
MMTVVSIILLILNIFLILFFYFKLKNQFSDKVLIDNIKNETQKLVAQIAFQTDRSVTIMEDKIREVNNIISELDKRILIAGKEEEKRSAADRVYQSLAESAKTFSGIERSVITKHERPVIENEDVKLKVNKSSKEVNEEEKKDTAVEEEPIKIYTKQILAPKSGIVPDRTAAMKEQIIEMAKKGLSIELIAEKIPLPTGEIELIISMNT